MANASDPGLTRRVLVDRAIFLSRLSTEISALGKISTDLQGALHNLPLSQSDQQTRKVLQSADKLTQSLDCLSSAIRGLSDLPVATREYDLSHVLDGVYLEDLRDRLIHGPNAAKLQGRKPPGEVDLF